MGLKHPGLHSEFQASYGYIVRFCLEKYLWVCLVVGFEISSFLLCSLGGLEIAVYPNF